MTPQEQSDLAAMHTKRKAILESMFDSMCYLAAADTSALANTGHKTAEAAIVYTFQHARREIQALTKAHIRKYPD